MTRTPDPIDVAVGRRLAALRISRGYNQSDLARSVGKTFQQIQKYEKGANRVSASVLFRFAGFLGVEPAYFFPAADDAATAEMAPIHDTSWTSRQGQQLARLFVGMDESRRTALLQCARALCGPTLVTTAEDGAVIMDEAA